MQETLTPPPDIEYDKDGFAMYELNPTTAELEEFGKDDDQWKWIVSNNNPEKEFKKSVRLGYFTTEQIEVFERIKAKMRVEDRVFYCAMVHCAEIVFPHLYKKEIDYSDEWSVHDGIYDNRIISHRMSDIHSRIRQFSYDVRDKKENIDDIIKVLTRYIYEWMHDNEYFVQYLNQLTKEQVLKIKMYLTGAVIFYQYYNLNSEK